MIVNTIVKIATVSTMPSAPEIVRETLPRLSLRIAGRSRGTPLEERREPDAEPGEDAEEHAGKTRVLDTALAEHDEHQDHPVEGLRDRRADKAEEDERRRLVRRIALLPRTDRGRRRETGSERGSRRAQPEARNRARNNHRIHLLFPFLWTFNPEP